MIITYYGPYFLSESDFQFLNTLNTVLISTGMVSLCISFIISGILAKHIVRPIRKTAYIANQISQGDYSIRFEGNTKSKELHALVSAINDLSCRLSEQERLRKQLTADVAHELRTPLSTLASHLEVMIEGVWKPTTARLQSCYEEFSRISGLVTDLEQLAQIENDNLILHKKPTDLLAIVCTVCDCFELEMQKKHLTLTLEGVSSHIMADHDKVHQLVMNLVSNAVKYTKEHGTIRIHVDTLEENVILIVEDDGIGIAQHELPLVFERFYRTDQSRNRKTGGTGIGLAIVKSIVTAHGGTVRAESHPQQQGSRFVVTLPK